MEIFVRGCCMRQVVVNGRNNESFEMKTMENFSLLSNSPSSLDFNSKLELSSPNCK